MHIIGGGIRECRGPRTLERLGLANPNPNPNPQKKTKSEASKKKKSEKNEEILLNPETDYPNVPLALGEKIEFKKPPSSVGVGATGLNVETQESMQEELDKAMNKGNLDLENVLFFLGS